MTKEDNYAKLIGANLNKKNPGNILIPEAKEGVGKYRHEAKGI